MFFTQEDYLKIQQWLQRNSVKDTEFQEAADLIGNEVVTLVQNGSNKKVYLKDLVNQIFSIGVTDFINVSSLYEKYNITLSEAIKLVPYKSRKRGQVITFLNTDGNWEIYQFTGVKNQWNNIELWKDLFDWQTILNISFEADEEDITSNTSNEEEKIKLSFKNREYDPLIHSGLGYKILRKNIVQYTDPTHEELTKNILYQDMVSNTYTIYEIRYDFDLNGQTINIPEGCVLQYRGGSLSNGTLIYEDTIIEGVERLSNVNIEGNYRYPYTGDESNPDTQLAPTMTQFRRLNTQVDNIADDEDLTKIYDDEKGQEVLQLKNRQYIQGSNNGMGYVILRQNKSFKEQLTQSNTIYEIRYDFDLGGEEVEIPENCVLKFEGGSLRNATIVGNGTEVRADDVYIFKNVTLTGRYVNGRMNVCWLGAQNSFSGYNLLNIDSTNAIQKALDINTELGFDAVYIPIGAYYVSSKLYMTRLKNIEIEGTPSWMSLSDLVRLKVNCESGIVYTDKNISLLHVDLEYPSYDFALQQSYPSLKIKGGCFDVSKVPNYTEKVIKFSDENGNTKLWGLHISSFIIGSLLHKTDNDSTAIYFNLKNAGFITMARIACGIKEMCTGISDGVFENGGWMTDMRDDSVMSCRCAICLNSIYSSQINGSYQAVSVYEQGNYGRGIIEINTNDIIISGKVWDCNMPSPSNPELRTSRYALIIGKKAAYTQVIGHLLSNPYLISGDYNNRDLGFNELENFLDRSTIGEIDYSVQGMVSSFDKQSLFTSGSKASPAIINFDTSKEGGSFVLNIPLKSKIPITRVEVTLSETYGYYCSFEDVKIDLLSDDVIVGSVSGYNHKYSGGGVYRKSSILFKFEHTSVSTANKIRLTLTNPVVAEYGDSKQALIYAIKANSTQKGAGYIDNAGRGCTMLYNGNSDHPKLAYGNYDNETLSALLPAPHYAMVNIGFQYAYVKNSTYWGIIAMRHPKLPTQGGWGLPTEKIAESIHNYITTPYEDGQNGKTYWYRNNAWREYDNAIAGVKRYGAFNDKPSASSIYVGFEYFCTDKQTTEGASDGIMICHKGNDVWVDALGRVVS